MPGSPSFGRYCAAPSARLPRCHGSSEGCSCGRACRAQRGAPIRRRSRRNACSGRMLAAGVSTSFRSCSAAPSARRPLGDTLSHGEVRALLASRPRDYQPHRGFELHASSET